MSLHSYCTPRESVFAANRRATVLSLESFIKGEVDGEEFFAENHFTNGMLALMDRALRHLGGGSVGSSIFMLSQAMGGGKTHSMIALGLLAQNPTLRHKVMGKEDPAPDLGLCRVIGFNGRNTDAPGGIWGRLAEQLDKSEQIARYCTPLLQAPGPEAWKQILGHDPLLIFLDELPPYLEAAVATPVGNADLGVVTTTALANLFIAVSELNNVCLVLSDLAGTNYSLGQQNLQNVFDRAVQGITNEARRIAVPITPVNPNGDELYHILRKRLFSAIGPETEVKRIAAAYRDALRTANTMGLTSTTPESLHERLLDSYPFHPDLRELVGKFKENEGFQQTRGVIRLMQMVVTDLWTSGKAKELDLVHPYDMDLNVDEIASEVRVINPALSEAIAHDIAHGGDAEAEQIDLTNHSQDATEASRLLLLASLSSTPGAIHGLREYQLVDALARPDRDISAFRASVVDKLAVRAWYMHNSADGRLFFKNQQNLTAKLRSVAQALHKETVDRMLRDHLAESFAPVFRDLYQEVLVLPPLDQVRLQQDSVTLVIVRPGGQANQLPISQEWQEWWDQQVFKNRVLFLSGSRDTYQKVIDIARQSKALQSIEKELHAENTAPNDPQWAALETLKDRVGLQFQSALKEAFDVLVYPSINSSLRPSGIQLAFSNNQNGEATLRHTLEQAQKFTTQIDADSFRTRAEGRLFGGSESRVVLWSDLKRAAATSTNWPLHKPDALDDLKEECLRRGLWRAEGNHIRRGPFPPPVPDVSVRELSQEDTGDGKTYLKIEPLHAEAVVFESGDAIPTPSSSPVPTPSRFEATGLRYRFLAYDANDTTRVSVVKDWSASLRLKHQIHSRGAQQEVELLALPRTSGVTIRYTTDGSAPSSSNASTYDGPFHVPDGCRVICAIAEAGTYGIRSDILRINIAAQGDTRSAIDPQKPATWRHSLKLDDNAAVWDLLEKIEQAPGVTAHEIGLTAESESGDQNVEYSGAGEDGYDGNTLKQTAEALQTLVGGGSLRMTVASLRFPTGQMLLDWLQANRQPLDPSKVTQ